MLASKEKKRGGDNQHSNLQNCFIDKATGTGCTFELQNHEGIFKLSMQPSLSIRTHSPWFSKSIQLTKMSNRGRDRPG